MSLSKWVPNILNTAEEAHSLQDGFSLGLLFSLSVFSPQAASVIFGAFGVDGATKKKRLLKFADRFIRSDDIADSPEYFAAGFVLGGSYGILRAGSWARGVVGA